MNAVTEGGGGHTGNKVALTGVVIEIHDKIETPGR